MGIGLYIHIPFCKKKCNYCDFVSLGIGEGAPIVERVAERLVCDVSRETEVCNSISSVFIGGGTPSVVPVGVMEPLLAVIRERIEDDAEWTIECNPGTVDAEKLRLYRAYGINRISIGCQSVHDAELRALGRIHDADDFYRTYDLAREAGFDNINVDLMSTIPGQTVRSWEKTLRSVIDLKPEHISAYSLILEPGTPFYETYASDPPTDEDTDLRMYEMTCEILEDAGFYHYEISNYAAMRRTSGEGVSTDVTGGYHREKPVEDFCYACHHNMNYWRRESYTGIGPAASSFYKDNGPFGTRHTNTNDIEGWLSGDAPVSEEPERLTREQALTEEVFLGLRMCEGMDMVSLKQTYGFDARSLWKDELKQMTDEMLVRMDEDRIFLTDKGLFVSDAVIDRLIRYF